MHRLRLTSVACLPNPERARSTTRGCLPVALTVTARAKLATVAVLANPANAWHSKRKRDLPSP